MTPDALDQRFERLGDGHYRLSVGDQHDTVLELRHVRRERFQLHGELTVRTSHIAARQMHGILAIVDVNVSTSRSLEDIAGSLQRRLGGELESWRRAADELGTAVAMAERTGEPSVRLTGERVERTDGGAYRVLGFTLPTRHPAILFGYGDTLKSWTATAILLELDRLGLSTLYVDAEMDVLDHQERAARYMQGGRTHFVRYLRCTRPLVFEADRIREVIREHGVQYVVFDSVGFLSHDKPESAESALKYFGAARTFGPIGSLHLAHRANSDHGDQFPFGSQFWHNSARATWYADRPDKSTEVPGIVEIAYHCRKFNLGAFPAPHGLRFAFEGDQTTVTPISPATVPELAKGLSVHRRIALVLKHGAADLDQICNELGDNAKADTVRRTLQRYSDPNDTKRHMFVRLADGRYANAERRLTA